MEIGTKTQQEDFTTSTFAYGIAIWAGRGHVRRRSPSAEAVQPHKRRARSGCRSPALRYAGSLT